MYKHLVASLVVTCTTLTLSSQSGLAQSPPAPEQDVLTWSDRDMSLRSGGYGPADTETSLRLPHIESPASYFDGRKSLVCEPGWVVFIEPDSAAYAQAGQQQAQKAR